MKYNIVKTMNQEERNNNNPKLSYDNSIKGNTINAITIKLNNKLNLRRPEQ